MYKTADNKWDCLAGTPVTGVKGSSENSYRRGNVEITKANIGLGNVDNTKDSEKSVKSATSATTATTATTANKVKAALTFTGGVTCSYDGSTAKSVAIPTKLPANGGNADTVDNYHIQLISETDYQKLTTKDAHTIYCRYK